MPKPTTLPRWNTDGTNRTAPSSGKMDTGFILNDKPTSGNFNWILYYIYSWLLWLDGLLTTNGGFTALANQDITVSGTGAFKHGDMVLQIAAADGQTDGVRTNTSNYWQFNAGGAGIPDHWTMVGNGGAVYFPVQLKVGDRIKSVKWYIRDTSSHTMNMQLFGGPIGTTNVVVAQTSGGTGSNQTLTSSSVTTTIAAGSFYSIEIKNNDTTGTDHRIYGIEVTYDHP